MFVSAFAQPTWRCWKLQELGQRGMSSLGAMLLFWQPEPSRHH